LLRRGERLTADVQRANVRAAAPALAAIAQEHELVLSHGSGPQVGLLALQSAAYTEVDTHPLDALGVQTEGMIAYVIEQELGNVLPTEVPLATVLTMVEVDPSDPAFENPERFVGPFYERDDADWLASDKGWKFGQDGDKWRRVVASPEPRRIFELRPIRWLLDKGAVVICAGGGGVPTMFDPHAERRLKGVEAVVDRDLASELLAREVGADLFIMVTDVDGVYADWGAGAQRKLDRISAEDLRSYDFAAGSMGPKIAAATRFVEATGKTAAIGGLDDIERVVAGEAGTQIVPRRGAAGGSGTTLVEAFGASRGRLAPAFVAPSGTQRAASHSLEP
jgi:carbamate kinase